MRTTAKYIIDEKGKATGVVLDIKTYKKMLQALEDSEDRRAYRAVLKEKPVEYSVIESKLKKDGLL